MKPELLRPLSAYMLATALLTATGCSSNSDEDPEKGSPGEEVSTPIDPTKPAEPAEPGEPAEPAEPEEPVEPEKPVDPVAPIDSETPKQEDNSTFDFGAPTYTVFESSSTIAIEVTRSGASAQAASVGFESVGGTALATDDYVVPSAELTWAAGETGSKSFAIEIVQDAETEEDETVELELVEPIGGTLGEQETTTLTIKDPASTACVDSNLKTIATSLTLGAGCYIIDNNISVSNAAILTIEPGATLKFAEGYGLTIESDGQLIAEGTAEQPIVFTAVLPAPGYWNGIEIDSVAASVLDHVVVEYGGSPATSAPANLHLERDGRAAITNSTFRYSGGYGLGLRDGARPTAFAGNTFTANEGVPVRVNTNSLGMLDSDSAYTGNRTASGETRDYILAVGTSVSTNQTWKNLGVPYHFTGLSTEVTAALTIEPGVTLVFPKDSQFQIDDSGTLNAVGEAERPITFTGAEKSPGFWRGVLVMNNNPNVIDHAIVEYGGAKGLMTGNVGTFGRAGRLSISNSTLRYSESAGLDLYAGATLTMANVTLVDNALPVAIDFDDVGQLDPLSSYTGNARDIIYVTGRELNTAKTIAKIVPYEVPGTTPTTITSTITIEPGVELRFRANGGLVIDATGALVAQGTAEEQVIFTGLEKTKGFWQGIEFRSNSQANVIDHAVVEFGGAPEGLVHALIGFWGSKSHGVVSNTTIRSSLTHGISVDADTTGAFSEGNTFEDIDGEEIRLRM